MEHIHILVTNLTYTHSDKILMILLIIIHIHFLKFNLYTLSHLVH
jgi:hypothetical protein